MLIDQLQYTEGSQRKCHKTWKLNRPILRILTLFKNTNSSILVCIFRWFFLKIPGLFFSLKVLSIFFLLKFNTLVYVLFIFIHKWCFSFPFSRTAHVVHLPLVTKVWFFKFLFHGFGEFDLFTITVFTPFKSLLLGVHIIFLLV